MAVKPKHMFYGAKYRHILLAISLYCKAMCLFADVVRCDLTEWFKSYTRLLSTMIHHLGYRISFNANWMLRIAKKESMRERASENTIS